MTKWGCLIIFISKLVVLLNFAVIALGDEPTSSEFRAFYFIQQWLPSYCNPQGTICCDPSAGKPTPNITIYGLWPYSDDGTALENCPGERFDVAPWLGSYCNQAGTKCCYPPSGKPSPDFTIDGLWPYSGDGNFAYNCGNDNYDVGRIKFLQDELRKSWPSFTCPQIGRKFWVHEWNKHGTCTKSVLGEIPYFEAALNLKNKANIYQALAKAGITPGNRFYSLDVIKKVLARSIGFNPWVRCNKNAQGNDQIWQVTFCADITGKNLIECPYIPSGVDDCKSQIQYPIYYQ